MNFMEGMQCPVQQQETEQVSNGVKIVSHFGSENQMQLFSYYITPWNITFVLLYGCNTSMSGRMQYTKSTHAFLFPYF